MSRLYYPEPAAARAAAGGARESVIGEVGEKVAKLVPAEIIAAYLPLMGIVTKVTNQALHLWLYGAIFIVCLILTPIYLNRFAESGKPKKRQLLLGTLAFLVWAYATSGQFVFGQSYDPAIAAIVLGLFSLASAVVPIP